MIAWLFAFACGSERAVPPADDRRQVLAALAALPDCAAAASTCSAVGAAARADCMLAIVEQCPKDPRAAGWCDQLDGVDHDECAFQRAERANDLDGCADAGAFVDDCRLHLWSRVKVPADRPLGEAVTGLRDEMTKRGIDPGDERFWSASFRRALGQMPALDRGACDTVTDAKLADACRHTAVALWHDLLNHERDFGAFPCDGGPLPPSLAHVPDPELDAILAERRANDLCRGRVAGGPPPAVP